MTLQDMIELAILDALGLLDEEETRAFESAYRGAAPAVQAQIRREQTRLARIEALLPNVTPPAELRAVVVEAIRREISATHVAGSINPAKSVADSMIPSRRVSPLWRAAALGMAAAAVVFGVTTLKFQFHLDEMRRQMQDSELLALVNTQFGPKVRDVLFSRDTKRVILTPAPSTKGQASIFLNPEWTDALFFCRAISAPAGRTLKVAIIDGDNKIVRELATFTSSGELKPLKVPIGRSEHGRVAVMTTTGEGSEFDSVLASGELPDQTL